jgi:hypothetical protein
VNSNVSFMRADDKSIQCIQNGRNFMFEASEEMFSLKPKCDLINNEIKQAVFPVKTSSLASFELARLQKVKSKITSLHQ